MAYLDKDGIVKVAPATQKHNDDIHKIIRSLDDIQLHLTNVLHQITDEAIKSDAELLDNIQYCHHLIEKCKERCYIYFSF